MTADHTSGGKRPRPLPCPHPGPAHDPDGRRQAVKIYEAAQEAHDSKEGDHDNNHEDRRQRMTADHASGPAAALSFSGIRPGSWMGRRDGHNGQGGRPAPRSGKRPPMLRAALDGGAGAHSGQSTRPARNINAHVYAQNALKPR